MMKRLGYLLILSCLCTGLTACAQAGPEPSGPVSVAVTVVDGVPVKSTHTKTEDDVRNLTIALYEGGSLSGTWYFPEMTDLRLTDVRLSRHYSVYALANMGQVTFPTSEADIPAMSVAWSNVKNNAAWPMAYSGEMDAVANGTLGIPLVRLVARMDLTVDVSELSLYKFKAQRVQLKSGAGDCRPFVNRSVPLSDPVQPDAASNSDVTAINAGGATSYYLLESCFGDLLPDNRDAWNKVPSSLTSGVEPPYVEITGVLTVDDNSGTTRNATYRFYLGQNATRNFDVVRNTINTVTLVLTDSNVDRGSWKVEVGPYNEKASLLFTPATLELPWMSTGTVGIRARPTNLKYRVYEKNGSMASAGLSFYRSGNTVVITSTREGTATGTLYASTLDGRLECSCRITTVVPPVTVTQIVLKCEGDYIDYMDLYRKREGAFFTCYADISYSDGTVETDVHDLSGFDWVIADEDVVSVAPGTTNMLGAWEPGETTGYIKKGNVMSNTLRFRVFSPNLSVRAVPATIDCGAQSTLMATYGGNSVSMSTVWSILEGDEFGSLEDRIYTTFVSNGSNESDETVIISGSYGGQTATCSLTIRGSGGTAGPTVTHELTVTPSYAEIDYNGTQDFTATYYTYEDGICTREKDVTDIASWSVSDATVVRMSGRGEARGCNEEQSEQTVTVTAMYAGYEDDATLKVGPAPVDPDPPGPGPGPDPGPDPPGPSLTGITLSLDKAKIWYGESVTATVTAWYDDGSNQDVTSQVQGWPDLEGCTRQGARYTHAASGLRSDALRTLSVTYGSFGAMSDFLLGKQYAARVEAVFPATLSWASERQEKPNFALVYNDGSRYEGHPGDMEYFTVDSGAPHNGGDEIGARDYAIGTHVLTVYVRAMDRTGSSELMSGSMSFVVTQ